MKPKSSQYVGVSFHKIHQKWFAYIMDARNPFAKRQVSLGLHDSELEAAQAYNEAALRIRGDNAVLNVLPPDPPPPEPHEIVAACEAIRETWSEEEFKERAPHWSAGGPELYVVNVGDLVVMSG